MPAIYSTYTDATLLQLLSRDDDKAFTEIYNRYWDKLLYIAAVKCRSIAIAEEIVQDIFLDLWNRRTTIDVREALDAYLAVSVKYRVINVHAKFKRALEYRHFASEALLSHDNSTEEWLRFHELKERLSQLVAKLPEKCRVTYQLSRENGLSQKQVASHLKVTEKAVEANLSRALKVLRTSLKNFIFFLM